MTVYCLEMRSTADWKDCRYRAYTTSARKAEAFRKVPRIDFTDSGHGIVPTVHEHYKGRREPPISTLADHVRKAMFKVRPLRKPRAARPELALLLVVARILRAKIKEDVAAQYRDDDIAALDEALAPWSPIDVEPTNECNDDYARGHVSRPDVVGEERPS